MADIALADLITAAAGPVEDGYSGVTHAGLAVVALDTGRVLLAQRSMDPTDDPDVRETWEFPGGGLDEGEEAFAGATREFEEETRLPFPAGEVVGGWRSDDGVYQGFVYAVAKEFPLANWTPTDEVQALRWMDRAAVDSMSSATDTGLERLRPEVETQTDWAMIFDVVSRADDVSGNEDSPVAASAWEDEGMDDYEPVYTPGDFDLDGPIPVHGIVAPEDVETGDMRGFSPGSMTRRPLRLPFRDVKSDVGAHDGAVTVGSVDRMMRKDGMIHWEGRLMNAADTDDLVGRMQFFDGQYGVSVDGDKGSFDAERSGNGPVTWFDKVRASGLTAVGIPAFHEAHVRFGLHPEMPADDTLAASAYEAGDLIGARAESVMHFDRGPGWVTNPKETKTIHDYWTKKGEPGYAKVAWGTPGDWTRAKKLIGAKIIEHSPDKARFLNQIISQWHFDALGYWPGDLDKPGNKTTAEARAERKAKMGHDIDFDEVVRLLGQEQRDELQPVTDDDSAVWEVVLVSSVSGNRVNPPLAYFHRYEDGDALTVEEPDANGIQRVHGYAAQWGVCHVGMGGRCVEPPRTGSDDYPDFHLGRTKTDEGYVYTGVLTYGVGHRDADTILSESPDQAYFDNVNNAWAAVRVGEDEVGIWFSGVVLPGVDPEHLVKIEASGQVSGEWLAGEMRACLTVNVPGFPVQRASVQYDEEGNVMALAASAFGQVPDAPCSQEDDPVGDLALEVMARIKAQERAAALRQEFALHRAQQIKKGWN